LISDWGIPQANPSTQAMDADGFVTKQATSAMAKSAERTVRVMAQCIKGSSPFCSIFGPTLQNKNEALSR